MQKLQLNPLTNSLCLLCMSTIISRLQWHLFIPLNLFSTLDATEVDLCASKNKTIQVFDQLEIKLCKIKPKNKKCSPQYNANLARITIFEDCSKQHYIHNLSHSARVKGPNVHNFQRSINGKIKTIYKSTHETPSKHLLEVLPTREPALGAEFLIPMHGSA